MKKIISWSVLGTILFSSLVYAQSSLVEVQSINQAIRLDLRYATANNFTNEIVYTRAKCYLRKEVADALNIVQKELEKRGLGLKIWDGWRPVKAQQKFWDLVQDERYVVNPKNGLSRHCRGTAVDLTLVKSDGSLVEMPTEFDDFSERAWRNYEGADVSEQAKKNARLLGSLMESAGFKGVTTEWWHFDYQGWKELPVIDASFEDLEKEILS